MTRITCWSFKPNLWSKKRVGFPVNYNRGLMRNGCSPSFPGTLEGFYRVCFLLDRIGKQPDDPVVWLDYLMSFFNDAMSAVELARYIYALDFLYFKCRSVQENAITQAMAYIERRFATAGEGMLTTSPNEAPIDAMRQIVFAINLIEDIRQDAAVNFGAATPQVRTIFDTIPDVPLAAAYIRNASDTG